MIQTHCRHFNGYRPCHFSEKCTSECLHKDIVQKSVLIVHLGALGAVVRSTCLLELIHRQHPQAVVTWVTDRPADQLLRGHPQITRVLTTTPEDLLIVQALHFDVAYVIDKSLKASAIASAAKVERTFGFTSHPKTGAILPATNAAQELWQLGLDNHLKFHVNQKSEQRLMIEALELPTGPLPFYNLPLTPLESRQAEQRKSHWQMNDDQIVLGINTGCSSVISAKKLSVPFQRRVIESLIGKGFGNIVLLGGPEDSERNAQIAKGLPVFQSPTEAGLRDGLISIAACDAVLTGDSLGMHMAISQRKYVIAWFGPTCPQEIDLYGWGRKVLSKAACKPCWKRTCDQSQMCYDQVDLHEVVEAIFQGQTEIFKQWQSNEFSSFKPLF